MLPTISLKGTGILEAAKFTAFRQKSYQELRRAVAAGFATAGPTVTSAVRANVGAKLRIRNRGFLNSYRHRVFASKLDRLPSMTVGSRALISGVQEFGASVRPRGRLLLIPFGSVRIGRKRFKELIRDLIRAGNAYFRQVNGRAILFAENIGENDRQLARFKRTERRTKGLKKLKRGADIPIAVGIPSVELRKRTDVVGTVRRNLSAIVQSIEHEIARNASGR